MPIQIMNRTVTVFRIHFYPRETIEDIQKMMLETKYYNRQIIGYVEAKHTLDPQELRSEAPVGNLYFPIIVNRQESEAEYGLSVIYDEIGDIAVPGDILKIVVCVPSVAHAITRPNLNEFIHQDIEEFDATVNVIRGAPVKDFYRGIMLAYVTDINVNYPTHYNPKLLILSLDNMKADNISRFIPWEPKSKVSILTAESGWKESKEWNERSKDDGLEFEMEKK